MNPGAPSEAPTLPPLAGRSSWLEDPSEATGPIPRILPPTSEREAYEQLRRALPLPEDELEQSARLMDTPLPMPSRTGAPLPATVQIEDVPTETDLALDAPHAPVVEELTEAEVRPLSSDSEDEPPAGTEGERASVQLALLRAQMAEYEPYMVEFARLVRRIDDAVSRIDQRDEEGLKVNKDIRAELQADIQGARLGPLLRQASELRGTRLWKAAEEPCLVAVRRWVGDNKVAAIIVGGISSAASFTLAVVGAVLIAYGPTLVRLLLELGGP